MSETITAPESRVDELTARVETLRAQRDALNQELTEAAQTHFQISEQAKIGLAPVAEVETPRAAKENLRLLLAEVEAEAAQAALDLDAAIAEQSEADFWAELRDLADQAAAKGVAFDAIRRRMGNEHTQGMAEMKSAYTDWEAMRQKFRAKAMTRISTQPDIPGKVGRYQSEIEHSKELMAQLSRSCDVRNLKEALPCESTFGLKPFNYPYGPPDVPETPGTEIIQRIFQQGGILI